MSCLIKPFSEGPLSLPNRLVMPPMGTEKADSSGQVNKEILDYYDEKTRGGYIGLVIVEHSYVSPEGKASPRQLSTADDPTIEGLKRLAGVIHANGSRAVVQINHAGSNTTDEVTGTTPLAPSAVRHPKRETNPRELTAAEIEDIIKAFGQAARRVKEAGFDGVEVHAAHGFLLNQFYSPLTNKRTDDYGGNLSNRIGLHLAVIESVRENVGEDYPLLLRLGASDYMEGGATIEDSKVAAGEFEKAGVDILDISGGLAGYSIPGLTGQGFFAPLTEAIKEKVSIPVILTGGITEARAAEELLARGKADLIGVGRAIFKDSSWARKAVESLQSY